MMKLKKDRQGFTLIELLVAVSVLIIMLVVGVPSFANLIDSNKLRTTRDLLVTSIHRAQQRASSNAVPVILCPSTDGKNCQTAWESGDGWLLFEDVNRNRELDTAEKDGIFLVQNDIKIGEIKSTYVPLVFASTGHARINTFTICSDLDGQDDLQLSISRSGAITYDASGDLCK